MIDNCKAFYKWHPEEYITHVIGHEGKNSLLSLLKDRDWATYTLSYSQPMPRQTIIGLEIQLTDNGKDHHRSVYNLVMDYISSLKPIKYIYEE